MLIEIEGIDGAGKTTQSHLLKEWMVGQGVNCVVVREPAGTRFGRRLKSLIMSGTPRDRKTETLAFLAAKSQLYSETITPTLARGKSVIADRGSLSFLTYHHISGGTEIPILESLMHFAIGEASTTLTILLDTPVEIAMERVRDRKNQSPFDRMGKVFFERQRDLFRRLCNERPNCVVIDGSPSVNVVHEAMKNRSSIFIR